MIKHIVTWKLDESYDSAERKEIIQAITQKLLGLRTEIDELKSIEVYTNSPEANDSNFDVLLDSEFETMDGLNVYQAHPAHQEVVRYIKTLKLQRAAIDYQV